MSLSQALIQNIETVIKFYVESVSEKYNLDKNELLELWTGSNKSLSQKTAVETIDMNDLSVERLHKCNKAELIALCKSKGHKCTGTKENLIDRLLGKENTSVSKKPEKNIETKEKAVVKKVERTSGNTDVIKKLTADIPVIPIRRNVHGNLEHPETSLVFDRKTETVVGKQEDDGTISELTDEDIESCKRFKFKYKIPDNLDKKDSLQNIKIKELDDNDSDIEIEDRESEDEEVEIEDDDDEDQEETVEEDD